MVCSLMSSRASRRSSAEPTMPRWPATKTVLPFSSNGVLAIGKLAPGDFEIDSHHLPDQLGEAALRLPAEFLTRLAGVADQEVDLGRAEICRIDAHHGLAGLAIGAGFLDPLAAPLNAAADLGEGKLDEFAHRARLAGRQHEIVRRLRLQDRMHTLDIIAGMAPVALGLEIAEIDRVFEPGLDTGDRSRALARHEGLAADRALVVEQDAVTGEHAIRLSVIYRDPVAVELGPAIGRARVERRRLPLRDLLHQTIQLGCGGLIKPCFPFHAKDADRLQQPEHTDRIRVGRVFRAFEA